MKKNFEKMRIWTLILVLAIVFIGVNSQTGNRTDKRGCVRPFIKVRP